MTSKPKKPQDDRVATGVPNLDDILHGGLPRHSVIVIAGPPGSGKTVLSQQIGFFNAGPSAKVLFFQTLSEPTAKRLKYLKDFDFFEPAKFDDDQVRYIDLGAPLRNDGIEATLKLLLDHVKKERPAMVIVDSFRAFDDFVASSEQQRRFSYEVVVNLMAWECTVLLLGEFSDDDIAVNPLFSVIDGIIIANQNEIAGEQRRHLQVTKMRGTDHSRDRHVFSIKSSGIQIYAPRVTIKQDPARDAKMVDKGRCVTGIASLDELLGEGIPRGSSLLLSGSAGAGKTLTMLEILYRGATEFGEKGIFFSFEETVERLCATGKGMGWDVEGEIKRGNLKIIFVPHPEILVEEHILMLREQADAFGASRIAIDSLSVFLDKVEHVQMAREKVFQLATIVQMTGAVGFFAADLPFGQVGLSDYGVAETVVDGVILLGSEARGASRDRYIEVYKLRNTAHAMGRHPMTISKSGITVAGTKKSKSDREKKKSKKSR